MEREKKRERRVKEGVWNSRDRGEKRSVERSGGGGVVGVTSSVTSAGRRHPCCREHQPTSSLLPSIPRPHPYALEQCQLSLKLLLVLFLPLSCSRLLYLKTLFGWNYIRLPPRFPAARLSDFNPHSASTAIGQIWCHRVDLKVKRVIFPVLKFSLMCKCKTSVGIPKSFRETRHINCTLN